MKDTGPTTPPVHPLQAFVISFVSKIGMILALALNILTVFSLYLVITSAFEVHQVIGIITLVLAVSSYALVGYIMALSRTSPITITGSNGTKPLDNFVPTYILLILYGFGQTFFWVIDSTKTIHEPRSVFILAVAGAFGYFHHQYQQALDTRPQQIHKVN